MSSPSDDIGGGPPPSSSAFTPSQIERYLRHVSFPLPLAHPRDARFLRTLHQCQITSIPYENLSLHYNPSHSNSIDPQQLYAKFIPGAQAEPAPQDGPGSVEEEGHQFTTTTSRGRGGFCFETSVFFLHVLRGLGFTAYPTAARIRIRDHLTRVPSGPFVGPRHVVNLVLLDDGSIWSCDVGFGGDGPTSPLRLHSGAEHLEEPEPEVVRNLGAQDVRLRRGVFPGTVRGDANRVWFYEYRNGGGGGGGVGGSGQQQQQQEGKQWNTYYAFGEAEASQWDLECANWWVAAHPESFQRRQVLAVKFLRDDEAQPQPSPGGQETGGVVVSVVGKMMLADGVLKRNMGGRTEVVKVCRSEEERVEVLREVFGIVLTEEERLGIRGFETELRQ